MEAILIESVDPILGEFQGHVASDTKRFDLYDLLVESFSAKIIADIGKFVRLRWIGNAIPVVLDDMWERLGLKRQLNSSFLINFEDGQLLCLVEIVYNSFILSSTNNSALLGYRVFMLDLEVLIEFDDLVCDGKFLVHDCVFALAASRIWIVVL